MSKSRECMYCDKMFDCKVNVDKSEYCVLFKVRNEKANELYKKWRAQEDEKNMQNM